jgi:hypothetical protein
MLAVVRVLAARRRATLIVVSTLMGITACGSSGSTSSHATSFVSAPRTAVAASRSASHVKKVTHRRRLGPLGAVRRYWRDIGASQYAAAFDYLAAGAVPQTQAQFVSDERQAGIESVDFAGRLAATTSSSATVAVTSLTTNDAQFGCRAWTGTYQLTKHANRWLIARASILPSPCPTQQPPSSPSTTTSTARESGAAGGIPPDEGPGSTSHAADAEFCTTHTCIPNFPNGSGYVVQCADGEWSHSGGLPGACSYHSRIVALPIAPVAATLAIALVAKQSPGLGERCDRNVATFGAAGSPKGVVRVPANLFRTLVHAGCRRSRAAAPGGRPPLPGRGGR